MQLDEHNAMAMRQYVWEPSFIVVNAHVDQVDRDGDIADNKLRNVTRFVDRAEEVAERNPRTAVAQLRAASNQLDTSDPWQAKLHASILNLMDELG